MTRENAKPEVKARRVVAEFDRDGVFVMWPGGGVSLFADAETVVRIIRKTDRIDAVRDDAIVATVIDWRNTPEGFVPPTADANVEGGRS